MDEFTKEQLIEKLERRLAVTTHYPDVEEAQLDAQIFKIALAALTAQEDNRIEYTRRVEAELITARARIALLEGLK